MGRVVVIVCDVCGELSKDASRYEVRGDGMRAVVELCGACAFPLARILRERGSHAAVRTAGVPDGRRATMEEIEAMKRAERVG